MKAKILFLMLVLFLLVGCQSESSDDSVMEEKDSVEKEEQSDVSEDLDEALTELDELENL